MKIRKRELRRVLREEVEKHLQREAYVKSVANKAATGEKFNEKDVEGLFSMIYDWKTDDDRTAAEAASAAWTNLISGLRDERHKEAAKEAYRTVVELSNLEKKRQDLYDSGVSMSSPEYEKIETKLNNIDNASRDLEDRLSKLSRILAKVHTAPRETTSSRETEWRPKESEKGHRTEPTFVGSKKRSN